MKAKMKNERKEKGEKLEKEMRDVYVLFKNLGTHTHKTHIQTRIGDDITVKLRTIIVACWHCLGLSEPRTCPMPRRASRLGWSLCW